MYFDDCEYDFPQVASQMTTFDAAGSVLDEDGKGGYRFDCMTFKGPLDIPGFFLGYMSGPILPETSEEREERHTRVTLVEEEPASTAGRTW